MDNLLIFQTQTFLRWRVLVRELNCLMLIISLGPVLMSCMLLSWLLYKLTTVNQLNVIFFSCEYKWPRVKNMKLRELLTWRKSCQRTEDRMYKYNGIASGREGWNNILKSWGDEKIWLEGVTKSTLRSNDFLSHCIVNSVVMIKYVIWYINNKLREAAGITNMKKVLSANWRSYV